MSKRNPEVNNQPGIPEEKGSFRLNIKDKLLNLAGAIVGGVALASAITPTEHYTVDQAGTLLVFGGSFLIGSILGWIGTDRLLNES
jgi:hypothetical protein